jgi:hypothetical protein
MCERVCLCVCVCVWCSLILAFVELPPTSNKSSLTAVQVHTLAAERSAVSTCYSSLLEKVTGYFCVFSFPQTSNMNLV